MALDRKKLAKICGIMGSGFPHEVSEAANKATAMIKAAGSTWQEVIEGAPAQAAPPPRQPHNHAPNRDKDRGDFKWDKFSSDYPEEASWISDKSATFDFAESVYQGVRRYGSLTERQMAAVRRCMARDAERDEEERMAPADEPPPRTRGAGRGSGRRRTAEEDDDIPF